MSTTEVANTVQGVSFVTGAERVGTAGSLRATAAAGTPFDPSVPLLAPADVAEVTAAAEEAYAIGRDSSPEQRAHGGPFQGTTDSRTAGELRAPR